MTSIHDQTGTSSKPQRSGYAQDTDVLQELIALTHEVPSHSKFMTELLKTTGAYFNSPYAAIHVRYASEVIQDDWHRGPTNPNFWKAHVQDFLTDALAEVKPRAKLLKSKSGVQQVAYLSAPIHDPAGPAIGAVAVVVSDIADLDLTHALMKLEAICRFGSFCAEYVGRQSDDHRSVAQPNRSMTRGATYATPHELAFALTNELRTKLGCELVALGLARFQSIDILSISGLDRVAPRSPGVVRLRAAMEECFDAGTDIGHPMSEEWTEASPAPAYRLHARWLQESHAAAVASLPLRANGEIRAILSLRREDGGPFRPDELESIRTQVEPFTPALVLTSRASRGLLRHGVDTVRTGIAGLTRRGHGMRKVVALMLFLGAMWFAFGTTNYGVDVPVVVRPDEARLLTMPFDGILAEAPVVQGDKVKKGDVLCRLDTRELLAQQKQLQAELAVAQRRRDQGLAERKPVDARLAEADINLVQSRLAMLDERLERTVIRSPLDGVVVEGDLRQAVGATLTRGQTLYRISPPNVWRLELEIPQYAAADVSAPLTGIFASQARPEEQYGFTVKRLLPSAVQRRNKTVYIAEATINARNDWMRPGMEGTARVNVGPRRVCWVMLHGVLDYLRVHLWL